MQLRSKLIINKEIYRMFAGDSQMLRNKRHFVISVIAINVFYVYVVRFCFLFGFVCSCKLFNYGLVFFFVI